MKNVDEWTDGEMTDALLYYKPTRKPKGLCYLKNNFYDYCGIARVY